MRTHSVIIAIAFLMTGCSPSFEAADIAAVKKSIRDEYSHREGIKSVEEIQLIQESARKLSGYLTVKLETGESITVPCDTIMGEDRQFLWTCKQSR